MKSIGIATDSHGGISQSEAKKLGIRVLPMPFYFGDECYYEDVSITREEFFQKLNSGENVSTSQPSPEAVIELWRDMLKEFEAVLYMPMSSGLSGSCNTARMLASDEEFEGKVFVVDNGRISTLQHRSILDALELIEEGYSAKEIQDILEKSRNDMTIFIAVENLEYLKRGGRISPATAMIGTVLNIKPILRLETGILESFSKCRGMKKAKADMLLAMKKELETTFSEYYKNNEVYMLAATSADEETTKEWVEEIREYFGLEVLSDPLSLGISCHTGEGALGIGISCRPKR
ncbi:MAG: DegV family protein [Lachnospiraceae bacterium]|nr:DegV family protein [Lachnospiraceae bacterium]